MTAVIGFEQGRCEQPLHRNPFGFSLRIVGISSQPCAE